MTLFVIRDPDELLAVRFACSPAWETLAAVRTFIDDVARSYHEPWHVLVGRRTSELDLAPLFAVEPLHGYVPDFLTPPPREPWPRLRDQLAEIARTPTAQVRHELELCRRELTDEGRRRAIDGLLADPRAALELLVARIHDAWGALVAPFWPRIRTLLARDVEARSRMLAERGLRAALEGIDPRIRWTGQGLSVRCRDQTEVGIDERGLVLMPSAYMWPHVGAVVDEPWQPTIIYPVLGVAELWEAPTVASEALARLLGRTRALVLSTLEQPLSTTALSALLELSAAGASRHLLALRDAGLVAGARHGHEVRYARTALGTALLRRSS